MKWTLLAFLAFAWCFVDGQNYSGNKARVEVMYSPDRPANVFTPSKTLGAAFDGHGQGDIDRILTTENVVAMRALGFRPLSYRLRTELGVEAWHWNPRGHWSDPTRRQGYWISDNHSDSDIQICNGYLLPRRGNTHDQANDDGYSMIDDGDTNTFWKSNPYLDSAFTNESNELHPQWVVVDLGKLFKVNAIKIYWGNLFAIDYHVDYALDIGKDYFDPMQPGLWHELPFGNVTDQQGGNRIVLLANKTLKLRFLRITMSKSSETGSSPSNDIRDKLGFAIKEIQVGWLDGENKFHDYVTHAPTNEKQSVIHTSSTDPWHRAKDIDLDTEQAGIDRLFKCGLTNDSPVLMPISLLYDTPENMVALLKYLKSKRYNVKELELGEEPEGQLINPQDYAALYIQWTDAIKKVDTSYRLGGPGFASLSSSSEDEYSFTEQKWTKIFLTYLQDHRHSADFDFFTFEWYPFDDVCAPPAPQLAANPVMMATSIRNLRENILPQDIPIYIMEYGYSSHSGRAQVDIEGALMYADIMGQSLTLGIGKAFLYGYEPTFLDQYNNCSWGNNMLFAMNEKGKIIFHTAAWYGVNMLTHWWAVPVDSALEVYSAKTVLVNEPEQKLITAYAILTPAKKWSIILINKDPKHTWNVDVSIFNTSSAARSALHYPVHMIQYSRLQYHWKANGPKGHPTLALPPIDKMIPSENIVTLPPYSVTIVREE